MRTLLAIAILLLVMLGAAGAWLILAIWTDSRAGWMALVIAGVPLLAQRLDAAGSGRARAWMAGVATASCILADYWLIAAWPIGAEVGQWPLTAAHHMGLDFAWTLTRLGNTPLDWLYAGAAPILAVLVARRDPRPLNARYRAP